MTDPTKDRLEHAILRTACGAERFATFHRTDGKVPSYIEVPLIEAMGQAEHLLTQADRGAEAVNQSRPSSHFGKARRKAGRS